MLFRRKTWFVLRQIAVGVIGVMLLAVIGGWWYVTDDARVRGLLQKVLSQKLNTTVTASHATLSLFDGLHVQNLVIADPTTDAPLLSVAGLSLRIDPEDLLRGRIAPRQLRAVEPVLRIVEDTNTGRLNVQELRVTRGEGKAMFALPEVLLRGGQIEFASRDAAGTIRPTGRTDVEGRFGQDPASPQEFHFAVTSRTGRKGLGGPSIVGTFDIGTGGLTLDLNDVDVQRDVALLPLKPVREWFSRNGVAGRMDVTQMKLITVDGQQRFEVQLDLRDVAMDVDSSQWLPQTGGPTPAIHLTDGRGTLLFSNDIIEIQSLLCTVEGQRLQISGKVNGYNSDAAAVIRLRTPADRPLTLPEDPGWLSAMPNAVKVLHDRFKPHGQAALDMAVTRATGQMPRLEATVNVVDGSFTFEQMPYPLQAARGTLKVVFQPGVEEWLTIENFSAAGPQHSPNDDVRLNVSGRVWPLDDFAGFDISVTANGLRPDDRLRESMPPRVREVLQELNAHDDLKLGGDLAARISRPPGQDMQWSFDIGLELRDSAGSIEGFAYPLRNLAGTVHVRDDVVSIEKVSASLNGQGVLRLDGDVFWGDAAAKRSPDPQQPLRVLPELFIAAKAVPLDETFFAALPEDAAELLRRNAVQGTMDISGQMGAKLPGQQPWHYTLRVLLKDTQVTPGERVTLTNVAGDIQATPGLLTITDVRGTLGKAGIVVRGTIDSTQRDEPAQLDVRLVADQLELTPDLKAILPQAGQRGWDAVGAAGRIKAELSFNGPAGAPATHWALMLEGDGMTTALHPQVLPLTFLNVGGRVMLSPGSLKFEGITAQHAGSVWRINGDAAFTPQGDQWNLKVKTSNLDLSQDVIAAMPQAVRAGIEALVLRGSIGADIDKLNLHIMPTMEGQTEPEITADFEALLRMEKASMDVGVIASDIVGVAKLTGSTAQNGNVQLEAALDVETLSLVGRPAEKLTATISVPAEGGQIFVKDLQTRFAGGELAGSFSGTLPEDDVNASPGRWQGQFVVKDANLKTLMAETEDDAINGALTASLDVEGRWGRPDDLRGRGDVQVTGKPLYRVPLLLGLSQLATLSLPGNQPFERATASYALNGEDVVFDSIELAGADSELSGTGIINLKDRTVRLEFATDNRLGPKVPILGEILNGARRELVKIQVRGTVEEPKVSARSFTTLTTTVDEVLRVED